MTGIEFLVILTIILIVLIIAVFIFNTFMFINLKSYHEIWKPIYENRKEHFDKYLKYALENSKSTEPIDNVAGYAAHIRIEKKKTKNKSYRYWKEYYLNELRSAGIE